MRGFDSLKADMRIAVVRALRGLGDMLCAVPALMALRRAYPHAYITLITLPSCRWVVERFGEVVNLLLPFPGYPGIPEQPYSPAALSQFLANAQLRPFDLAVQMHGSGRFSNSFVAALGARSTAGLYEVGRHRPPGRFFPYPNLGHETHRWLYLMRALELPLLQDNRMFFPVSATDRAALSNHPALNKLATGSFVCIHAGSHDPARRWPAARFAKVADALASKGYGVVLTGTLEERATADSVAARMQNRPVNVAGETSLGLMAALLERAALIVTNDTGTSHLAAALRTPSVVLFLASNADRWAPVDRRRHRAVLGSKVARSELHHGQLRSMRCSGSPNPAPGEVLDEAFSLLEEGLAA